VERLSAQDLSMVLAEEFGWPQDIGALAILDGSQLPAAEGRFPIDAVRERIGRRLHLLPRFRQLLYAPRWGLGWPLWVDDPAFDIAGHVNVFPRGIADEAQLLAACEQLRRQRLDRSRPLWQMWFLPGLADGRVGLFMKLHHAIADGVAGVAAFGTFLDLGPGAPAPSPPPWAPAPFPSGGELFGDNLRRKMQAGRGTLAALGHPRATARQARRAWPAVRENFAEGGAPRTSLNQPIGAGRTLAVVRSSLGQVKGIAHAHHATVNDVLAAAAAGGLRTLLAGRGERVDGLVLRAFVPVSLHREQPGPARGNLDGAMIVPLPIGEADHVHRLQLIAAETAQRKKKNRPAAGTLFRNAVIQRAFLRYADRQRFMNVYIANVPGPPVPLYLAGAPLAEVFPVVPIMGNVPLGIGALSYAGQFNITVVADRDGCPDAEVFTTALRASLDNLTHAAPVPS
jgi:diacylglycerol O-acyltransferase / wax synthase